MAGDDGEKTEDPTEHKLQEARKKGQVFKSTEIITSIQFAAMVVVFVWTGSWATRSLLYFTSDLYRGVRYLPFHSSDVWVMWMHVIGVFAKMLLPMMSVAVIAALLLNMVQTGLMFSAEPMNPTLQKISPLEGFKRILSRKSLMELFKQVFKLAIIGYVTYKILKDAISTLVWSVVWDFHKSAIFTKNMTMKIVWYVTLSYLALAILDYLIQRKFFMQQMRMSIQELKDEFKDTEGDPHVKARMRQSQRQMVEQSVAQDVPKASAVVTNPTHLAVAIRYEQGKMEAPVVLAKGERLLAQRIREVAEEHEVPVIENVGLARALFEACKVGQMIPGDMYKAVAEVLAFVFRLKRKRDLAKRRSILKVRESAQMKSKAARKR